MSTPRTLLDNAASKLPSPNGVALAIMELWDDDNTSVEQLAGLVQTDPALAGRLLKLANSASLGTRKVSSISGAIIKVGMKTVGQLAVAFSLIDKAFQGQCRAFDYTGFWSQCLMMALVCRGLGRLTGVAPPDDVFSCALMARIGLLAFATVYPEEYSQLLEANPQDLAAAERQQFGFDHAELSMEMLADFGVPEVLAVPAGLHEGRTPPRFAAGSREDRLSKLFRVGYRLSEMGLQDGGELDLGTLDRLQELDSLGLSGEQAAQVFEESREEWKDWLMLLDLPMPSAAAPRSPAQSGAGGEANADQANAAQAGVASEHREAAVLAEGYPLSVVLISSRGAEHPLQDTFAALGFRTLAFADQREMLRLALEIRPHVIIVDDYGTDPKRDKLCRLIRSTEWGQSVYLIALLEDSHRQRQTEAFHSGADACMQGDLTATELDARLNAVRRIAELHATWQKDRAELQKIANQLALSQRRTEVLSLTDQLTGLPNRRSAIEAMEQAWANSDPAAGPLLSVIMIDIDHFKRVNDTWGHAAGDKVLVDVGNALSDAAGQAESVYRMGGEEFLFLITRADFKQLIVTAERLRRRVASLAVPYEQDVLEVTISLGLAQRGPEHVHYDALLVHADQALYAAKTGGRNRMYLYRNQQMVPLSLSQKG